MTSALRRARSALAALVAAAVIASVRPAAADGEAPKMDNRARAQQLFDSALADAEAGNLPSACPKFLASHEADPKASTLLNLASCYEKNGQTASAWGAFREAEVLARKVGHSDWETNARSHAEMLEPRLVRLTVQVPEPSRVPELVVMRDGTRIAVGEWGVAIPVDPGEHVVTASAAGRAPWESRTAVRDASATVAVPVLEPLAVPEAAPAPVAPREDSSTHEVVAASWWTPLRTTGVVVAGVGVVGLVTGAVLGLVAKGKYDDARARCADGARACPPGAVADSDSAYGMATGATVVFVLGAAAAAGGAALVLFSSPSPAPSAAARGSARASASLVVTPGTVGVHGQW